MHEQRLLFEARTAYDAGAYRALVQMMLRKLRRWPRLAVMTLGFGTLALAGYRLFSGSSFDLLCILFLLFGNALILFSVFAEYFLVQMLLAETGKSAPLVNCYRFRDDCLEIRSGNAAPESIPYSRITRILEYGHYLFLFVDGRTSYILDPRSLVRGSEAALRTFLNEKLHENLRR